MLYALLIVRVQCKNAFEFNSFNNNRSSRSCWRSSVYNNRSSSVADNSRSSCVDTSRSSSVADSRSSSVTDSRSTAFAGAGQKPIFGIAEAVRAAVVARVPS